MSEQVEGTVKWFNEIVAIVGDNCCVLLDARPKVRFFSLIKYTKPERKRSIQSKNEFFIRQRGQDKLLKNRTKKHVVVAT